MAAAVSANINHPPILTLGALKRMLKRIPREYDTRPIFVNQDEALFFLRSEWWTWDREEMTELECRKGVFLYLDPILEAEPEGLEDEDE